MINANLVQELRKITGIGMMECKKALTATDGDIDKAINYLRVNGSMIDKVKNRESNEGTVGSYIHAEGRIGVLVQVNCETDFVSRSDEFKKFVKDIAMQIAATNPLFISREEIPNDIIYSEKLILREQTIKEGKPERIVDKIVDGKMTKYYKNVCLLEQQFVKDQNRTINDILTEQIQKFKENIVITNFTRYEITK